MPGQGWRVVISHHGFARMGHLALGCKCLLTSRWHMAQSPMPALVGPKGPQRSVERRH
jgi:hypothetical protein